MPSSSPHSEPGNTSDSWQRRLLVLKLCDPTCRAGWTALTATSGQSGEGASTWQDGSHQGEDTGKETLRYFKSSDTFKFGLWRKETKAQPLKARLG